MKGERGVPSSQALAGSLGYQLLGCLRGGEAEPGVCLRPPEQIKVEVKILAKGAVLGGQAQFLSTCLPFVLSGITFP